MNSFYPTRNQSIAKYLFNSCYHARNLGIHIKENTLLWGSIVLCRKETHRCDQLNQ